MENHCAAAATENLSKPTVVLTFPKSTVFPTYQILDLNTGYKFRRNRNGDYPWNRGFNYYTRHCIVRGLLVKRHPDPLELATLPATTGLGQDDVGTTLGQDKVTGLKKFLNKCGYWLDPEDKDKDQGDEAQESFVDPYDHNLTQFRFFRDEFLPRYCGKQYRRKKKGV